MRAAVLAGLAYFAIVFALGFALGTARALLIAPRLGQLGAVAVELPVMLAASWLACGGLVRRFAVPPTPEARIVMGGFAFALLMAAELGVSVVAFSRTPAAHFAADQALAAQLGLAAQLLFAAFPLIRR
jgi:hypothetical protein